MAEEGKPGVFCAAVCKGVCDLGSVLSEDNANVYKIFVCLFVSILGVAAQDIEEVSAALSVFWICIFSWL